MKVSGLASLLLSLAVVFIAAKPAEAQMAETRLVRYSTGPKVTTGWEKPLVEARPNLGRYYWMPLVSTGEAYKKIAIPVRRAGGIYTKPIHVPLPVAQHSGQPADESLNTSASLSYERGQSAGQTQRVARYAPVVLASSNGGNTAKTSVAAKLCREEAPAAMHAVAGSLKAKI